jgi:hypothetical protein
MNCASGPRTIEVGADSAAIEPVSDLSLSLPFMNEGPIDIANDLHFLARAESEDNAIGLNAFVLSTPQHGLHMTLFVDKRPPKPETRAAALAESFFN